MSTRTITKKELNIPIGVIIEVADMLLENEIIFDIVGTDEDNDALIIEVECEKEQREIIHQIEDTIDDYEEDDDGEEEEEDRRKKK